MATKHSKQIPNKAHIGKTEAKAILNPRPADIKSHGPKPQDPLGYQKILIVSDAVDIKTCQFFCDYTNERMNSRIQARIGALGDYQSSDAALEHNMNIRDAYRILTNEIPDSLLRSIICNALTTYVEPFYKVKVEWWEEPNLLLYTKGGKYEPHTDADIGYADIDGKTKWGRALDRDISILLYLNDGFTGGLLSFPGYNIKIQPKPGMLVAFPSSSEYMHAAEPTETGCRLVLVSWAALEGVPRVSSKHPFDVVYMKQCR